jgi:predicted N-formylglutamate amidohydrolase
MLQETALQTDKGDGAVVVGNNCSSPIVVVCEHGGLALPAALGDLGLSGRERTSHIAWDPGAATVAEKVGNLLNATVVRQRYSRLVYDCNRPPSSDDAMRDLSETTKIPGNSNLSKAEKKWRIENIYEPFHREVARQLDRHRAPVLVTVHSFTPVFHDRKRLVGVGILHDEDSRLADAMLAVGGFDDDVAVRRNDPYGPEDGVTHTLQKHGLARGILNVMVEIRNDLIDDEVAQDHYGRQLASVISKAIEKINSDKQGV